MTTRLTVVALLTLVLVSAAAGPGAAGPSEEPAGELLYVSTRAPSLYGEVYSLRPDGRGRRNLSRFGHSDGGAVASPDGRLVAFVSTRGRARAVWVTSLERSRPRRVSAREGLCGSLVWSPHSDRIAYCAAGRSGKYKLYVTSVRPGGQRLVLSDALVDDAPAWSPDGRHLAHVRSSGRVEVRRLDGRSLWSRRGRAPRWSPDGKWIAYDVEARTPAGSRVSVVTPSGRLVRSVRGNVVSWSPAGEHLLIYREDGAYVLSVATGKLGRFRPFGEVRWSPDGEWLLHSAPNGGIAITPRTGGRARILRRSGVPADWSPDGRAILVRDGRRLVVLAANGRRAKTVVSEPKGVFIVGASWPRAGRLLFTSYGESRPNIYRTSLTSRRTTRLTSSDFWEHDVAWAADGSRIAFSRVEALHSDGRCPCRSWIFTASSDGRDVRRLTTTTDELSLAYSPTWGPGDAGIAFVRGGETVSGSLRIVESGRERTLTREGVSGPSWSPDGAAIAFSGNNTGPGIYLINPDGSSERKLVATGDESGEQPAWAPDGSSLAYEDARAIWIVHADGSGRTRLTTGSDPTWSADGRWIAFVRRAHLSPYVVNDDIYAVRPDGTGLRRLVGGPAQEGEPAWR